MNANKLFQIIAACQGAFVLSISIVIFFTYLSLPRTERDLLIHILFISISYALLIGCTLISIYNDFYSAGHIWRFMCLGAYVVGDFSLIKMFRRVRDKKRRIRKY